MIKQTENTGRMAQKITGLHLHRTSSIPNVKTIALLCVEDISKAANADNSTKMQQGEERAPAS
jgi:fructoselysine-6-P-deglycase FrlB-like protein